MPIPTGNSLPTPAFKGTYRFTQAEQRKSTNSPATTTLLSSRSNLNEGRNERSGTGYQHPGFQENHPTITRHFGEWWRSKFRRRPMVGLADMTPVSTESVSWCLLASRLSLGIIGSQIRLPNQPNPIQLFLVVQPWPSRAITQGFSWICQLLGRGNSQGTNRRPRSSRHLKALPPAPSGPTGTDANIKCAKPGMQKQNLGGQELGPPKLIL